MCSPVKSEENRSAPTDAEKWVVGRHHIVGVDRLPRDEAEQWRSKLTTLATDCGCGLGTALGMVTLAIYLTAVVIGVGPVRGRIWMGVGIFIVGAAFGKFVGIWRARRALDRSVNELKHQIILSRYGM